MKGKGNRWSKRDEHALIHMYEAGETFETIGAALDRSESACQGHIYTLRKQGRPVKKIPPRAPHDKTEWVTAAMLAQEVSFLIECDGTIVDALNEVRAEIEQAQARTQRVALQCATGLGVVFLLTAIAIVSNLL